MFFYKETWSELYRPRGTLARCCPGGRPGRRRWCLSQSWGCSESASRVLRFGRAWTPTGRSVPCQSLEAPTTTWRRRCCWGGAPPQPALPADLLLHKEVKTVSWSSLDSSARPPDAKLTNFNLINWRRAGGKLKTSNRNHKLDVEDFDFDFYL